VDGTDIPNLADVSATDPSAVGVVVASIAITNTVYLGSDAAGSGCESAVEYVEGGAGTDAVYCFRITNYGTTYLNNIVLKDEALGFSKVDVKMLAPGESVLVPFKATILSNLTNIATVVGNPVFANGTDIPKLADVTATDPSSVGVLVPSITITNTVYLGSDAAGSGCESAVEYVEGGAGTEAVYCFRITNNGNTYLNNIALKDEALAFNKVDIKMLAPGESVLVPLPATILSNLTNVATVVGNPVFADGKDIPNLTDVTATDPSAVGVVVASIAITNTVYLGSDAAGSGCESAVEYVEGGAGTDAVYCFRITNHGTTYLNNVVLKNDALSFSKVDIKMLAPGESVLVPLKATILSNLTNIATVIGNPVFANGTDIPKLAIVTANDPSSVGVLVPSITITNTVYLGSDAAGSGCESAVEYVEGGAGTDAVYCFRITNNGNTYLNNIALKDEALAFNKVDIKMLAPGESVLVPLKATILSNLTNTATVVGNPVFVDGTDIPNLVDVTANDPSAVGVLSASIALTNTVYLGSDAAGSGCASAVEYVEGLKDTEVVYCFLISNNGATYLNNIMLKDDALTFTKIDIKMLAPGESVLVPLKASILSNLTNVATVVGNPVSADGTDIPNLDDVTATDPSSVGKLRPTPRDPPYSPPGNVTKCLQDSWNETGKSGGDLICTTKEVYLESLTSKPITCVAGEKVKVSVTAVINIASSRSDLGWYVAADGGDALEGTCIVNGLQEMYDYKFTNSTFGGEVTWDDDNCGDVTISGGGGKLEIPVVVNSEVLCADENEDGKLDLAVCFTWNNKATDAICTLSSSDKATQGSLPDLYPGSASMCYCESYNIQNSTVVTPKDDDITPCK
jgi:uncharacterized membrane protein